MADYAGAGPRWAALDPEGRVTVYTAAYRRKSCNRDQTNSRRALKNRGRLSRSHRRHKIGSTRRAWFRPKAPTSRSVCLVGIFSTDV